MTLQELLADRALTTALIIDDGYDTVPKAVDLVSDEDWSNFFADIGEDRDHVIAAFPAYDHLNADTLRHSDEFIASVWNLRGSLRPDLFATLFNTYEQTKRTDRAFLDKLEAALKAVGLAPLRSGRDLLPEGANQANIIFADLFLGTAQEEGDIEVSIRRLTELLAGRDNEPPIVVLMSRSHLIEEKKIHFRDKAKLLGTMFRVYQKETLLEGCKIAELLGAGPRASH
jgi:hypothetical protein